MSIFTHQGYSAGHPWYYLLGGAVPSIKAIRTCAMSGGYAGCAARLIQEADAKPEPKRSEALRYLRNRALEDLQSDISRYRECARELRKWRDQHGGAETPECGGVHTAISLKFTASLLDST